MTLPEIRAELLAMAERLTLLAHETKRRPPTKRAKKTSVRVTAAIRADVKRTHKAHPSWSNARIGRKYPIDGGRVSEIISGKRK